MAMAGKQPKAMSSRLATMKFMQRSSNSASAAAGGDASSEPSPKRQRLSTGSHAASPASTPSRINPNSQIDGEWYLSYKAQGNPGAAAAAAAATLQSPLRVVTAGYSFLDTPEQRKSARAQVGQEAREDEEEESEAEVVTGRMNFGKFGQKQEQKKKKHGSDSEDLSGSDEEEEDDEDESDPANATSVDAHIKQGRKDAAERIRAERKAKKHADNAELRQLGGERRKKDVKLNRLSGISGGSGGHGGSSSMSGGGASNASCYTCGKRGHMKKDCPTAASAGSKGRKSF